MSWNLERPTPVLPHSHFWTWDHSTNWVLDDPGALNFGCTNRYLKRAETFVEDYRRLTDCAAGLGLKKIMIWGFLRDSHGGVESARRVAAYAASKGVGILAGVGTSGYGGVYYEGEHPYNLETFLRKYPEAHCKNEKGGQVPRHACSTHPAFVDWLKEGLHWLFRELPLGGCNLENGDFLVCHCSRCRENRADWPKDDPEFFHNQALSYLPALDALRGEMDRKLITWATYTGFVPGKGERHHSAFMQCARPALLDRAPSEAVTQWTITRMVRDQPLPLTAYLDDGAPAAAFDAPGWPTALKPPSARSVGFLHQASQWHCNAPLPILRYDLMLNVIKEGCLRAQRAGLEGVVIHGEVTARHIPWALNYLAFSHFTHWPLDNMRAFGRKTLGQVLESEAEGEAFIEALCARESNTLSAAQKSEIAAKASALGHSVRAGKDLERWRFWEWLHMMSQGLHERHTANFF